MLNYFDMNDSSDKKNTSTVPRREFFKSVAATVGLSAIPGLSSAKAFMPLTQSKLTVQQVIDMILKEIPGAPFPKTVDTLKSGDGKQVVTGIVTTMFATVDVIRRTASLGANFIIAQ